MSRQLVGLRGPCSLRYRRPDGIQPEAVGKMESKLYFFDRESNSRARLVCEVKFSANVQKHK